MFKLQVEILEIWQTETLGSNGFEKRIAIVKTVEPFPQTLKMEFTQNNVNLLDSVKVGEVKNVSFNIKGNEGTGNTGNRVFFQSLNAWKIEP